MTGWLCLVLVTLRNTLNKMKVENQAGGYRVKGAVTL